LKAEIVLLEEKIEAVKTCSQGPDEMMRLLRFEGSETIFAMPERCLPEIQVPIEQHAPPILSILAELPDLRPFEYVVLAPEIESRTNQNCVRRNAELDDHFHICMPYDGVSLRQEIFETWALILEQKAPRQRYLFELAFALQKELGERSPIYLNSSHAFVSVIVSLLGGVDYEAILSQSPLQNYLGLCAMADVAERQRDMNIEIGARSQWVLNQRSILSKRYMESLCAQLTEIASDATNADARIAATKLLLHFGTVSQLERLRNIEALSFRAEPVAEDVVSRLKYLSGLQSLDLSDTYFPEESVRHLQFLPVLKSLSLRNTKIGNSALVHLANCEALEELDCSDTRISDEGVRHFSKFKRLKRLVLARTFLSSELKRSLQNFDFAVVT